MISPAFFGWRGFNRNMQMNADGNGGRVVSERFNQQRASAPSRETSAPSTERLSGREPPP